MNTVLQLAGALLILVPFAWSQAGSLGTTSTTYLTLNVLGSILLAYLALDGHQWGFLLLELVWGAVSAWSLTRHRGEGRRPPEPSHP